MKFLHTADRERYRRMTTSELREAYLIDNMFVPGEVTLCYTDVERSVVGSAIPVYENISFLFLSRECAATSGALGSRAVLPQSAPIFHPLFRG